MKVKALQDGFFDGSRIRAGKVFDVPEGTKAKWFVPMAEFKAPAAPTKGRQEPRTLAEAAKVESKTFVEAHKEKADLA